MPFLFKICPTESSGEKLVLFFFLIPRYIKGETDRIKALCEMKRLRGQHEAAKGILESLKTATFSTDTARNKYISL